MKRGVFLLSLLAGCEWPVARLADRLADASPDARADDDAAADEDFIPCSRAEDCPNPRAPDEVLCNLARGECVECLSDRDCPANETCDADGECDD